MTDISTLGEFGLIKRLTKSFEINNPQTVKGVGDDAAVFDYAGECTVVTTDLLIEGVHFDLSYVPLIHLGYKAVAVNLSDVYAMNAKPLQITVSIAVSNRFTLEAVEEIYKGIKLACDNYNIDLAGGDTSSSVTGMIISITALGTVSKENVVYRSGAKQNDLLCVSGDLGAAYAGLQLLEREKSVFSANPEIQPDLKGYEYILQRQLKPEARKDIIEILEKNNIVPTSMIDISDGLSSEILHICEMSKCGCSVYEEKIPIAEQTKAFAKELLIDPTVFALSGGEDYELLFTVSQTDYEKISKIPEISIIGHILDIEKSAYLVTRDGTEIKIEAQGWNALGK